MLFSAKNFVWLLFFLFHLSRHYNRISSAANKNSNMATYLYAFHWSSYAVLSLCFTVKTFPFLCLLRVFFIVIFMIMQRIEQLYTIKFTEKNTTFLLKNKVQTFWFAKKSIRLCSSYCSHQIKILYYGLREKNPSVQKWPACLIQS